MSILNEEFNFGSYWTLFSSFKACKLLKNDYTLCGNKKIFNSVGVSTGILVTF